MLRAQSVPAAKRTCDVCAAPGVAVMSAASAARAVAAGHILMQLTLRHQWSIVNWSAHANNADRELLQPTRVRRLLRRQVRAPGGRAVPQARPRQDGVGGSSPSSSARGSRRDRAGDRRRGRRDPARAAQARRRARRQPRARRPPTTARRAASCARPGSTSARRPAAARHRRGPRGRRARRRRRAAPRGLLLPRLRAAARRGRRAHAAGCSCSAIRRATSPLARGRPRRRTSRFRLRGKRVPHVRAPAGGDARRLPRARPLARRTRTPGPCGRSRGSAASGA